MAKKISSSYIRKKADIKRSVTQRAVEKIRIAANGPGYRTGGQVKTGTTNIKGSPTGTKVRTLKNGQQITVAKTKGRNPNTTPKSSQLVEAKGMTRVRTQVIGKPFQKISNRAKPYAGKARPVLRTEIEKRRKRRTK